MTPFQKIIKYAAIAFGTYLTVIIITVAVSIITGIFAASEFVDLYKSNKSNRIEDRLEVHKEYYDITDSL